MRKRWYLSKHQRRGRSFRLPLSALYGLSLRRHRCTGLAVLSYKSDLVSLCVASLCNTQISCLMAALPTSTERRPMHVYLKLRAKYDVGVLTISISISLSYQNQAGRRFAGACFSWVAFVSFCVLLTLARWSYAGKRDLGFSLLKVVVTDSSYVSTQCPYAFCGRPLSFSN